MIYSLVLAGALLATSSQPNFVLIITDDIGQQDLGCYGSGDVRTPNLDRMAREGVLFENAYLTCASCSPSRCSLITGRYPHNTGAAELHTALPDGHTLFPKVLHDAGYYTVMSGKHHMGRNVDVAFDKISPGKGPGKQGDWVEILRDRPKDRPFFCWFAAGDAHRSWSQSDDAPTYQPSELSVPPFLADGPLTRQDLAEYYHEVSRTDTFAGRIVEELERQGVADNTYVIYMSDNGRPFPRCKTRLYDSGIKTPLIVYAPSNVVPARVTSLVSANLDVGVTLLELAGLPVSERFQGISFTPQLKSADAITREIVFAEQNWHVMQAHQRMVRHGDYVYIRNAYPERQTMCLESNPKFPAGKELWDLEAKGLLSDQQRDVFQKPRPYEELFLLSSDPHQLTNLVPMPEHRRTLDQCREMLDAWTRETLDSIPKNPTRDRQSATGPRDPKWRHQEQPGTALGSVETTARGPVLLAEVERSVISEPITQKWPSPVFVDRTPTLVLSEGAGEGPAWHPNVGLIFSGHGKINRLTTEGQLDVFSDAAATNGLLFSKDGTLICCENALGRVTQISADGTRTTLTEEYARARYNQPNDVTIDSRGRIYFSDPKYGPRDAIPQQDQTGRPIEGVYRIDPSGQVARIITHEVDRPNGVLVTSDNEFLFVADNNNNSEGGARILWRFKLRENGTVDFESKTKIYDWGTGRGPDGMIQDSRGLIYVAGGLNRPNPPYETVDRENRAGIYVFTVDGKLVEFVAVPRDEVTNCTLAGPNRDQLYITAGGTLWMLDLAL